MASIPLLLKDELECLDAPTRLDSFSVCPVKRTLTVVAQEVREVLQQSQPLQLDSINRAETIMIRAIEPEYKQVISIESLTARELEVLQLIVDGHNNPTIAEKLYITPGTVKTHVRNILKKLCVSDRTQAAIRALRCGLFH
jgi:DNA-binding NarL/FixJ family response regulator